VRQVSVYGQQNGVGVCSFAFRQLFCIVPFINGVGHAVIRCRIAPSEDELSMKRQKHKDLEVSAFPPSTCMLSFFLHLHVLTFTCIPRTCFNFFERTAIDGLLIDVMFLGVFLLSLRFPYRVTRCL